MAIKYNSNTNAVKELKYKNSVGEFDVNQFYYDNKLVWSKPYKLTFANTIDKNQFIIKRSSGFPTEASVSDILTENSTIFHGETLNVNTTFGVSYTLKIDGPKTINKTYDLKFTTTLTQPSFTLSGYDGKATVYWGDGSVEEFNSDSKGYIYCTKSTSYASTPNEITVVIKGTASEDSAFNTDYSSYSKITSMELQDSLHCLLGHDYYWSNLETLKLGEGFKMLGAKNSYSSNFRAGKLKNLYIPKSLIGYAGHLFPSIYHDTNWTTYYNGTIEDWNNIVIFQYTSISSYDSLANGPVFFKDINGNSYEVKSVTLPNTITKIRPAMFGNFINLTSLTIPNSVTEIGEECIAFTGITELTVPSSVTKIAGDAFKYSNLTTLTIESDETLVFPYSQSLPSGLVNLTIPSFPDMDKLYFNYSMRKKLKYLHLTCGTTVQEELMYGGNFSASDGYNALETLVLGNSIKVVGKRAFQFCHNLKNVTLGENLQIIEYEAFDSTAIEKLTIPDSVHTLDDYALPYTLTSISSYPYWVGDCSEVLDYKYITSSNMLVQFYNFELGNLHNNTTFTRIDPELYDCSSTTSPPNYDIIGAGLRFNLPTTTSAPVRLKLFDGKNNLLYSGLHNVNKDGTYYAYTYTNNPPTPYTYYAYVEIDGIPRGAYSSAKFSSIDTNSSDIVYSSGLVKNLPLIYTAQPKLSIASTLSATSGKDYTIKVYNPNSYPVTANIMINLNGERQVITKLIDAKSSYLYTGNTTIKLTIVVNASFSAEGGYVFEGGVSTSSTITVSSGGSIVGPGDITPTPMP